MKTGRVKKDILVINIIIIVMLIIILIPILYMLLIAFTPYQELFVRLIPSKFTFLNFVKVLNNTGNVRSYLNSLIIGNATAILTVVISSLASYGLSRFRFKMKNSLIIIILFTQILPMEVLAISYFKIVSALGMYNNIFTLIILDCTITIPFVTLMLKSIFDTIPKEIEESAMIDGCNRLTSFLKIIVPINLGGIFAAYIFSFLQSYSEYLYGLVLTSDYRAQPMTVNIGKLMGQYSTSWEQMMAMITMFSLPIFILFTFTQRIFIKGLIAGSVKE
jgi:multiple sugar transport system permease protein